MKPEASRLSRLRQPHVRSLLGRVRWGLVDQFLSSGTNVAVALLVVRSVDAEAFGAFSLVVLIYVLAIGTLAAINTQPLVVRSAGSDLALTSAKAPGLGVAAVAGCVLGMSCLAASVAAPGTLQPFLIVLGLTLPLLLVQDAGRGIFFALGHPRAAAANDAGWAALLVLALAGLSSTGELSPTTMLAAWLGSGSVAGVAMMAQLETVPAGIRASVRWLRTNVNLGAQLFGSYILTVAPSYVLFALAPAITDLADLGLARAAYLPFAAFGVVLQGASLLLLPAVAGKQVAAVSRSVQRASMVLGVSALAWTGIILLATPDSVGELILGEQWQPTENLRRIFGIALVCQAAGLGAVVALSSLAADRLFRLRLLTGSLSFACGVVLTYQLGATGLAIGIAIGDVATATTAWFTLRKLGRTQQRRAPNGAH